MTQSTGKPPRPGLSNEAGRTYRWAVLLFFTVSGATGLVLEVVWTRRLGVVFGNTVLATSTVLTAFMLGLALGSALFGRLADRMRRPLVLYGCLELGIGCCALLFPPLTAACDHVYGAFYRSFSPGPLALNAVRLALCLAVLLPPSLLMGGTLPVLGRHLGRSPRGPGQEIGYLYGANTLGGVLGCFGAGFVLVALWGVGGTLAAAAGAALTVGALAVLMGLRSSASPAPALTAGASSRNKAATFQSILATEFRFVCVAFAVTGFCSMGYEVLWTRVLIFLLTTSVYAFASMLTAFLAGIALGSFLCARWVVPRLRRPLWWFGLLEILIGLAALGSVPLLAHLDQIDTRLFPATAAGGLGRLVGKYLTDTFVVLLAPTVLMGAVFPIVTQGCLRGEAALGQKLGQLYAANTLGCVIGALSGGFVLLPLLGTHHGLLVLVAMNLLVGSVLLWRASDSAWPARLRWLTPLGALAVAAFLFTPADVFHQTINTFFHPSRLIFFQEHPAGTVTVHQLSSGERLLSVEGVTVAGLDLMLRTTQKLQGYIPLCLHPHPRRVVQIGFGSGETTRVGLEYGVPDYSVVEICPAVFEAGKCFEAINGGSYRDPRVHHLIMDGKNFALLSGGQFDIIMNDSIFPGSSGSSALYTLDHFRNCRARLAEGGLFSCWVPLDLKPREMRMILRSFQEVFPHTSFWVASNCVNKNGLILGSLAPLRIDFARLKTRLDQPAIRADLAAIELHDVYDFLDCYLCDETAIRRLVDEDPFNTDDRPRLEFSCALRPPWQLALEADLAMLVGFHTPVAPCVEHFLDPEKDREELRRRFEATTHVFRAQVAQLAGLPTVRRNELDLALKANPGETHVRTCEEELAREIRDLQQLVHDYPAYPVFVERLAGKLFTALRYADAKPLYEKLIATAHSTSPGSFVHLAEIEFYFGRAERAEALLRRCLARWPNSAQAHDCLGGICQRTHRPEEAWTHLNEALRLDPGNPLYQAHEAALLKSLRPPLTPAPLPVN